MKGVSGSNESDKVGMTRSFRRQLSTRIRKKISFPVIDRGAPINRATPEETSSSSQKHGIEQKSDRVDRDATPARTENSRTRRPARNIQKISASMPPQRSINNAMSEYEKKVRRKLEEMDNREKYKSRTVNGDNSVEGTEQRSLSVPECGNNGRGRVESPPAASRGSVDSLLCTQDTTFEERLAHKLEASGGTKKWSHDKPTSHDATFDERLARKLELTRGTKKGGHEHPHSQHETFDERLAHKIESTGGKKKRSRKKSTSKTKSEKVSRNCSESWECNTCTFVNVPEQESDQIAVCQICNEPKDKPKVKDKIRDTSSKPRLTKGVSLRASAPTREAKNDANSLGISWSELGVEIAAAAENSISGDIESPMLQLNRSSSIRVLGSPSKTEFRKRMLLRTTQYGGSFRGSCSRFSQLAIAEAILEDKESDVDDTIRSSDKMDSCNKLMRSCSFSNLRSGAWKCSTCTHINEPVGLDPCTVCRICNELNTTNKDQTISQQVQRREQLETSQRKSKDDMDSSLWVSWSDLGGAIAVAVSISVKNMDTDVPENLPGRVCNDSGSWACNHCTYRNVDGAAIFCGVCGQRRYSNVLMVS